MNPSVQSQNKTIVKQVEISLLTVSKRKKKKLVPQLRKFFIQSLGYQKASPSAILF